MKWLVKLFCPSGETLAGYAAEAVKKSVNSSKEENRAKVAKYATYAHEATSIANKLSGMVSDGTMDSAEKDELQKMLTPLFEKLLALV